MRPTVRLLAAVLSFSVAAQPVLAQTYSFRTGLKMLYVKPSSPTTPPSTGGDTQPPTEGGGTPAASVSLSTASLSFSNVAVGASSLGKSVLLTNNGTASATLGVPSVSGDFAATTSCGSTLAAGASCLVTVSFNPTAEGSRTGSLSVSVDGTARSVSLSGTGLQAKVGLSVDTLSFSAIAPGSQSIAKTVTVTNTGTAEAVLGTPAATGDFAVSSTCESTLAPGATCTLSVTFSPSAAGPRAGTLSLASGGTSFEVSLTGTGLGAAVTPSTDALSFGTVVVGQTSTVRTVLFTNDGGQAATLGVPATSGDYASTTDCTSSLAPAESCSVSVTFTPTATGVRSGALTLSVNGNPVTVTLAGTGSAALTVTPYGALTEDAPVNPGFGAVDARTADSLSKTFYLVRSGTQTTALSVSATITGADAADFVFTSAAKYNKVYAPGSGYQADWLTCGATIQASTLSNCVADTWSANNPGLRDVLFSVRFKPTTAGTKSATLTISHNGTNTTPLVYTLTGTGNAVSVAQLSSPSAALGSVEVGQYSEASIVLTNVGSAEMTLPSAPAISGSAQYSATTNCGGTLAIDESCTTTVRFTPTAMGAAAASKLVFSTSARNTPVEVTLTGTGLQGVGSLQAVTDANFGTIDAGATATRSFVFTNTGNMAITGVRAALDAGLSSTVSGCGTVASPLTLAANETCTMTVTFAPSVAGSYSGKVYVYSTAANSPTSLNLVGTAVEVARVLSISPAVGGRTSWDFAVDGPLSIAAAGTYSITVSTPTAVSAKFWGGGGAGSTATYSNTAAAAAKGGGGGYAGGNTVLQPGLTYTLVVGSGGTAGATATTTYGKGGGVLGGSRSSGGQGGGYTALFAGAEAQANAILVAGGGGGAAGDGPYVRAGTGGGGSTVTSTSATAPTASAPGTGASGMTGAKATTSYGYYTSGGGGGGYWGGGAFSGNDYFGGTGGMGYAHPSIVTGGSLITGGAGIAGNATDTSRPTNAGAGGRYVATTTVAGKPGAAVLY